MAAGMRQWLKPESKTADYRMAARRCKGWVLAMLARHSRAVGRYSAARPGTRIYFYKRIARSARPQDRERAGDGGEPRAFFLLLRAYRIFHSSQIDGISDYVPPGSSERLWQEPDAVRKIIAVSKIDVRSDDGRACYVPAEDVICLPPTRAFSNADLWAEVALHEFAHATGAQSRLGRKLSTIFGSSDYAFEELIVSLATSMVGPELGVAVDFDNQASYIDDWLSALRTEKKTIFRAAAEAQRIADYILGLHPDYAAVHAQPDSDSDNDATKDASDARAEAA
jgi:antirestriction protein ArdC